jgi:hypothetical protein
MWEKLLLIEICAVEEGRHEWKVDEVVLVSRIHVISVRIWGLFEKFDSVSIF